MDSRTASGRALFSFSGSPGGHAAQSSGPSRIMGATCTRAMHALVGSSYGNRGGFGLSVAVVTLLSFDIKMINTSRRCSRFLCIQLPPLPTLCAEDLTGHAAPAAAVGGNA
ncbi:hypothetical protein C8Q70DRAFT_931897 [Cubamyces menziesii]|nr:hypothetical protein C8Q70DRAFT_931897 [Cubamyces menziesii]